MITEEDMKMVDPLEWIPDWMGNTEAQQAVVRQMRESPEYRNHFYANVEGLSFGEVLVILQNFKLNDQMLFLTNEVITRLKPTVFTAFKPSDLPNYPSISFRYSTLRRLLSEFHPDTLIALIERHLAKYSFMDRRLAPWILQVAPRYQLRPKTWSRSLVAWEIFSAEALLLASRTDTILIESIMKIMQALPGDIDRLVRFRIGVRRVVRLKLLLYNYYADFDEPSRIILQKAFDNLVSLTIQIFMKFNWMEKQDYAVIGTWLSHLHDQSKAWWRSGRTPHPPAGHLIESLLTLENIQHPEDRFERRWQWQILQVLMPQSGSIPNLAPFMENLVVDADPSTIVWEEIAGLCTELQKLGYLGAWRRMIEVFERINEELYKKMSEMETVIYIDTFEDTIETPETPSKDCIIQ